MEQSGLTKGLFIKQSKTPFKAAAMVQPISRRLVTSVKCSTEVRKVWRHVCVEVVIACMPIYTRWSQIWTLIEMKAAAYLTDK